MNWFISKNFSHKKSGNFNNHELSLIHINKSNLKDTYPIYIQYRASANVKASLSDVKKYLKAEFSIKDNHILAAYKDNKIVGFVHYCTEHSTLRPADRLAIKSVFVSPEYRGQGIAKKLLCYLKEHLTVTEIRVKARRANQASTNLYLAVGFFEDTEYTHMVYRPKK